VSRLLVDTHTLLWALARVEALSPDATVAITDPGNDAFVSAATVWEIAIKRSVGKLEVPDDLPEIIAARGFTWLPVSSAHAWAARDLPMHHRDPFDRMLIAQAQCEQLAIVTADADFAAYDVDVVW
jgi:PIN domain nuclease of toxin-antitoxin system